MIAILRWELSRRRFFILWWVIGVVILVSVLLAIYPSIHQQAAQLDQVLKQMPESVRALRGGDTDLTSPIGYLNAEIFYVTLPLLLIILAINLGSGLLARDEQDHTLELLLARPVSRGTVLTGKALAGLMIMAIVGGIATIAAVIGTKLAGMDIAAHFVVMAGGEATVFATAFGVITFTLNAASILSRRLGVAVAVAASFGGYLLQSLSSVSDYIKEPATFFPYHYYVPKDILAGTIDRGFTLYMLGILAAGIIISYLGFRRRDIG